MTKTDCYILDANFFIQIKKANPPKFFERFKEAKNQLPWVFFISDVVFREIKFIYYSHKQAEIFQEIVQVEEVQPAQIEKIKGNKSLSHYLPQDPDLSLVVLAKKLKPKYTKCTLITDDYKLSEFAEKHKISVLSNSAFLLKLANNIKGQSLRRFFINLRKQVQKEEIEYVLERKDIYPAYQKLSWLIERAINVSEEKITFQEEIQECYDENNAEDRIKQELWLAKRVLLGESLSKKQKGEIRHLYPLLNKLSDQLKKVRKAQRLIIQNENLQAMEVLKDVERILTNEFILEKAKFISHHTPELLIADILTRTNFLHALSSVQIGGIPEAKRFFDNTATYGLIARKQKLILISILLSALIFVFNNQWAEAIEQYQLSIELSRKFGDDQLQLKSLLGQSIVQFISGQYTAAIKNLEIIRTLLQKNYLKAPLILEEFGDTFYALGMTDYAITIYREALEYQIELGTGILPDNLIEKIRKCFLIQGIREPETPKEFSEFMDSIHDLDGKFFSQYDDTMAKIFEINKLLYKPFSEFTDNPRKLSDSTIEGISDWFDVIDVETSDETRQILIAYSSKLGLFGIELLESSLIIPIPENYQIRLKPSSQLIIRSPSPAQQEKYLIRAIIQIESDLDLEIKRCMPSFYEALLTS
ncbi:MAG: hypothetical protein ACTSRC_19645 [Candidatus Helarchaeota archaeon]